MIPLLWLLGVLLTAFGMGCLGEDADDYHPGWFVFIAIAWPLMLFAFGLRALNALGLALYERRES